MREPILTVGYTDVDGTGQASTFLLSGRKP
jgi:hypothetical protein